MKPVISLVAVMFALILLAPFAFAECPAGESSYYVPAVVGSDGGLVKISVKLFSGVGDTYLTTQPHTGVSTQISTEDAIAVAFSKSNSDVSECDVLVKIEGKGVADYVDGPSAGAAVAVTTYSALTGKPLRDDATITGAIDPGGNIQSVGGLYEKSKAVARYGLKYFVTPMNRLAERLLLAPVEKAYNVTIVEVANINEAIDFLVEGKEIQKKGFQAMKKPMPNVSNYSSSSILLGIEPFKKVSDDVITIERTMVENMGNNTQETEEMKEFFTNEIDRQKFILDDCYLFTAANEAFLSYIDVVTVSSAENLNPEQRFQSAKSCASSIKEVPKSSANFEWLVGADLREGWVIQRLQKIDVSKASLIEEKYFVFNQIMYADAWCFVSKELSGVAVSMDAESQNSSAINESLWKSLAESKIKQAEGMNITFEDWAEHVDNSKALYERGKYGAAIYDAVFAMEMNLADMDIANKEDTLIPLAEQMNLENRTSIWGKIYHTQGAFLMQEGGEGGKRSAYRIFKYAKALDSATEEMKALTFPLVESVEQPVSESNKDGVGIVDSLLKNKKLFLLIGAIVLLGIAAVVYLLGKNKTGKNKKAIFNRV